MTTFQSNERRYVPPPRRPAGKARRVVKGVRKVVRPAAQATAAKVKPVLGRLGLMKAKLWSTWRWLVLVYRLLVLWWHAYASRARLFALLKMCPGTAWRWLGRGLQYLCRQRRHVRKCLRISTSLTVLAVMIWWYCDEPLVAVNDAAEEVQNARSALRANVQPVLERLPQGPSLDWGWNRERQTCAWADEGLLVEWLDGRLNEERNRAASATALDHRLQELQARLRELKSDDFVGTFDQRRQESALTAEIEQAEQELAQTQGQYGTDAALRHGLVFYHLQDVQGELLQQSARLQHAYETLEAYYQRAARRYRWRSRLSRRSAATCSRLGREAEQLALQCNLSAANTELARRMLVQCLDDLEQDRQLLEWQFRFNSAHANAESTPLPTDILIEFHSTLALLRVQLETLGGVSPPRDDGPPTATNAEFERWLHRTNPSYWGWFCSFFPDFQGIAYSGLTAVKDGVTCLLGAWFGDEWLTSGGSRAAVRGGPQTVFRDRHWQQPAESPDEFPFNHLFQTRSRLMKLQSNIELAGGLDLGTAYCSATIQRRGSVTQLTFPNDGRQLPAAILWTADGQPQYFGQAAFNAASKDPQRLTTQVKRLIPSAPDTQLWPDGPTPVEYQAALLQYIWQTMLAAHPDIQQFIPELGGTQSPDKLCVIVTHPAHYHTAELQALQRACQLVPGLGDAGLIAEPIAGAHVFRKDHGHRLRRGDKLAVVDIGAGTTDLTLLEWDGAKFEPVVSAKGDGQLGGLNFSRRIFCRWCEEHGWPLQQCYDDERGLNLAADPSLSDAERRLAIKLAAKADAAKIQLSAVPEVKDFLDWGEECFELEFSRDHADQLWHDLWPRVEAAVDDLLTGSALSWSDVEHVVLLGGSAMLPGLRERVARVTGRPTENVCRHSDPSHAIANGAAWQAFCQENTGHCLPGGLGVRLKVGSNGATTFKSRFFFATGEIIPADGKTVERLGQKIDSPGGDCLIEANLVEAKQGVTANTGDLLDDDAVIPVATIREQCRLPKGVHETQLTFDIDANGKAFVGIRLPNVPEMDVISMSLNGTSLTMPAAVPRDLLLLLDCSSSMNGTKLRILKDATHHFLECVAPLDVRVGLVEFGRRTRLTHRVTPDLQDLADVIEDLVATGGTPMAEALTIATAEMQQLAKDRQPIVVVVTDGHPNSVDDALAAGDEVKLSARLVTIGIGDDVQDAVLSRLASTPADYFFAKHVSAVEGIFERIVDLYLDGDAEAEPPAGDPAPPSNPPPATS